MSSFLKYKDESYINIIYNKTAVFYGSFIVCFQDENMIVLKNKDIKYSLFGSGLSVAAVSRPKTVIKGIIERIEFN